MDYENDRVRALRKDQRLTLEKFGEKLGITRSAVSNIESGNRNVTEQMRRSICREFGVREDWLRTGEGNMYEPQSKDALDVLTDEFGFSAKERRVAEIFLTLDATRRKAALEYLSDVIDALNGDNDSVETPEETPHLTEAEIEAQGEAFKALLRGEQQVKKQLDAEVLRYIAATSAYNRSEISGASGTSGSSTEGNIA